MQPPNPAAPAPPSLDETGRKIRRSAFIVAVVLILGFLIMHFIKSHEQNSVAEGTVRSSSAPQLVDVITVRPSPATLDLKLPGETAAWYESIIYARVDGYVGKWNVDIGDHVKKGQVLATIETPELDAQLSAALAKLQAAQATVKAREADAEFARTTYARWKDSPRGVVSEQEREAKKAGFNSATAQLNEAQAQVALDKADAERYTVLARFKQVTAPYDGKITERHIDIGNLVAAGSSANTTPLYKMAQNDPIRVFIDVPQSAAGDMKVGTAAEVTADSIAGHVFKGKITRTADAISEQTRTLRVEVDIKNPDEALVQGMYVDIGFKVPTAGLLQIPAAALVFRSGGPEVAVVDKDNHVTFHKVTIARDNGNAVEIGSGITQGDQVALNISNQITEGETVQVSESRESPAHVAAQK